MGGRRGAASGTGGSGAASLVGDERAIVELEHPVRHTDPFIASSSCTTSPAAACRLSFDFWNTGTPSRTTSKRPPDDGISATSASGNRSRTSAASLTARGS